MKTGRSKGNIARYAAVALLAIMYATSASAQADIHFSQFYETSILRNPALTGVFEADYKFGAYMRNQWSSISHPYVTALVSGEYRTSVSQSSNDFISFGLLGYHDKAGSIDQKITGVYPAINYNKSISESHNTFLSVGLTGGYLQYSYDPAKATFNNQYLPGSGFNNTNPTGEMLTNAKMNLWDVGAGINFNTSTGENNRSTFVIGVSGYHFMQPKFSYFNVPGITQNIRWNANLAYSTAVTETIDVVVHSNYAVQATYNELLVGGLVSWTERNVSIIPMFTISGGVFYRYNDALIPVIKVRYKNAALGFSYDVNMSTLTPASKMQGAYEITLFIVGKRGNDKSGVLKKTLCPRFF